MKHIDQPKHVLDKTFGYPGFRDLQGEAIDSILSEQDTLVIFKTSGGKSLCYQVPALCVQGTALVISPLVSLMKDQVDALADKGVDCAYLNSTQTQAQRQAVEDALLAGELKLLYVSPERLNDHFLSRLASVNISFCAIDEAHCVSLYGNDFRPAYTKIGAFLDALGKLRGRRIARIALTATAQKSIRDDVISLLGMKNTQALIGGFERNNISFSVKKVSDKASAVVDLIRQYGKDPMIVYSSTVKAARALHEHLQNENISASLYHGQLPSDEKRYIQAEFSTGRQKVMIATNAFGMGVDKADVRTVVHLNMPAHLENYYQEAGRAGRDGQASRAILLFQDSDRNIHDFFIQATYPSPTHTMGAYAYLNALPSSEMPMDTTPAQLAAEVPGEVDEVSIKSVMRVLEEMRLIQIRRARGDARWLIDTIDPEDEVDFGFIETRRQSAQRNLNKMLEYVHHRGCRMNFLVSHFGQEPSEPCGHCDRCKPSEAPNRFMVPSEYVAHVLKTVGQKEGYYTLARLRRLLNTTAQDADTPSDAQGCLSHWTNVGIDQFLNTLIGKSFLFVSGNKLYLAADGLSAASGQIRPMITLDEDPRAHQTSVKPAAPASIEDVITTAPPKALMQGLTKLRSVLSQRFQRQPNHLLTDLELAAIALHQPQSLTDLQMIGLREETLNRIGDALIKTLPMLYAKFGD